MCSTIGILTKYSVTDDVYHSPYLEIHVFVTVKHWTIRLVDPAICVGNSPLNVGVALTD
jgi:hypothetical protein